MTVHSTKLRKYFKNGLIELKQNHNWLKLNEHIKAFSHKCNCASLTAVVRKIKKMHFKDLLSDDTMENICFLCIKMNAYLNFYSNHKINSRNDFTRRVKKSKNSFVLGYSKAHHGFSY